MRKINLLLLLLCHFSLATIAQPGQTQQIKIVNCTVKNQLPAIIDNWNNMPGSLLLVAQKSPATREFKGVKLLLQIKSGGSLICGSNYSNGLPVDDFTTRSFNVNELTGLLSACHELKDGSYTICAQFFSVERLAISNEVCKEFTVETAKETDYSPPTLITPENGKEYSSTDMIKPVMFRWSPVSPRTTALITYRIQVFEILNKQTPMQALRANQPLLDQEIRGATQYIWQPQMSFIWVQPGDTDGDGTFDPLKTISQQNHGFIWTIQTLDDHGLPVTQTDGNGEARSEPVVFYVKDKAQKQ
jgi:hypothetical protein